MFKLFHRWLNPHCHECELERECKTCDILRSLLESERFNNKQLLNSLLKQHEPLVETKHELPQPLQNKSIPWNVRKQLLEDEERAKAQIMRQKVAESIENKKSTAQLESELGIEVNNAS